MIEAGILCKRVRKEDKQLIAALDATGIASRHLSPTSIPLPTGPREARGQTSDENSAIGLVIDRCQDRDIGSNLIMLYRAIGVPVVDAGLASTSSRLELALRLDAAGIPRPASRFVIPGDSALAFVEEIGFPSTLLPTLPGTKQLPVYDRDIAEALIEHRETLGTPHDAVMLVQSGSAQSNDSIELVIVDNDVIAARFEDDETDVSEEAKILATSASRVIGAQLAAVELLKLNGELVVYDIQPVPEFRNHKPIEDRTVAEAVAALVTRQLAPSSPAANGPSVQVTSLHSQAVSDGVVFTA